MTGARFGEIGFAVVPLQNGEAANDGRYNLRRIVGAAESRSRFAANETPKSRFTKSGCAHRMRETFSKNFL